MGAKGPLHRGAERGVLGDAGRDGTGSRLHIGVAILRPSRVDDGRRAPVGAALRRYPEGKYMLSLLVPALASLGEARWMDVYGSAAA